MSHVVVQDVSLWQRRGRPALGSDRTATAGQGSGHPGTSPDERSACPARDLVRAGHRHRVGRPASGTGIRVRHDLLAAATRLAGGRGGAKHHIRTCGNGLPLAVVQSAANVNDHLVLPELLDRVRPLRGRPGRPCEKITTLIADKGYDYPRVYDELERRRITGYIPRRGTREKVSAGRWIVEQTLALLHKYRRLTIRWERRTDIHQGFLDLAVALICWRRLSNRT